MMKEVLDVLLMAKYASPKRVVLVLRVVWVGKEKVNLKMNVKIKIKLMKFRNMGFEDDDCIFFEMWNLEVR